MPPPRKRHNFGGVRQGWLIHSPHALHFTSLTDSPNQSFTAQDTSRPRPTAKPRARTDAVDVSIASFFATLGAGLRRARRRSSQRLLCGTARAMAQWHLQGQGGDTTKTSFVMLRGQGVSTSMHRGSSTSSKLLAATSTAAEACHMIMPFFYRMKCAG